jgi:hypothetical protein
MSENNKLFHVGAAVSVDPETGETIPIEGGGFRMLPGPKESCEWCHVVHDPKEPHNQQSLSYHMKFHAIKGRYPTWTDAMAHCSEEVREMWKEELIKILKEIGQEIPEDLL